MSKVQFFSDVGVIRFTFMLSLRKRKVYHAINLIEGDDKVDSSKLLPIVVLVVSGLGACTMMVMFGGNMSAAHGGGDSGVW